MAELKYLPHYTVDDYKLWEGDWELIDGIPYATAPSPFGPHQRAASKGISSFERQLSPCKDCIPNYELTCSVRLSVKALFSK